MKLAYGPCAGPVRDPICGAWECPRGIPALEDLYDGWQAQCRDCRRDWEAAVDRALESSADMRRDDSTPAECGT